MNVRRNEINELFHFFEDVKEHEIPFDRVFERLENEIKAEIKVNGDTPNNEYLENLRKVHTVGLKHYLGVEDYSEWLSHFRQTVKLYGLGVAQ